MKVELLYFKGCPNISMARKNLNEAFAKADIPAQWDEIDLNDPNMPKELKGYGSPTILIDGKDVTGIVAEGESLSCRTYYTAKGEITGAPDAEIIVKAILESAQKGQKAQKGKTLFSIIIALFLVFTAASIPFAAIYYPAPSFDLKEAVENGENISLDKILKDKDTKGVMLYFMTTW
ncbi:MAG: hypothetical protein AABY39_05285 [Nitrospirota bacterium]|jgi:hypothetical protein